MKDLTQTCTNPLEDHRTSHEDQVVASLDICSLHPHRCCRQFPRWLRGWPHGSLRRSEVMAPQVLAPHLFEMICNI